MNICILGTGKMGTWMAHRLSAEHTVSVFDTDSKKAQAVGGGSSRGQRPSGWSMVMGSL